MSTQDKYGNLGKIASLLHKYRLTHPALASIPVLVFDLVIDKPYMGAICGIFAYLAREIFHVQTGHGPGKWYIGLLPNKWSKDNILDWVPVVVWCFILAYVLDWVTKFSIL